MQLPPNRVRRNYMGGALLDAFEGKEKAVDGDRPEDWIASTVRAVNPGLPEIKNEGLARIANDSGKLIPLLELFKQHPEHYLGKRHVKKGGINLGFLVKLLDSSMRLHLQAHPTKEFARKVLNAPWGKLETYVILGVRPGIKPYIRLGFQHPPSKGEFKRIIEEQDIKALDACFEPIPVKIGDVWMIPGGLPHAIGEGLFLLEVMEPSDLVVRVEFEREGIILPSDARFMKKGIDFALKLFKFEKLPIGKATEKYKIKPKIIRKNPSLVEEMLIDSSHTDCFSVKRYRVRREKSSIQKPGKILIGINTNGRGSIKVENDEINIEPGDRFLIPSAARVFSIDPSRDEPLDLIACFPGKYYK